MTQEEFAEKIGISFNYVGMIERGLRVPKLETFIKIANVLGVTSDYLLADYITAKEDKQNAELNERIERLSESDRKHILEVIDLLIKQTGNEQYMRKNPSDDSEGLSFCSKSTKK